MAGDNRHVTENFLRLNFSPKPGITPGTNDFILMDCDQIAARYYVSIAGVSSTGKRLPSQNQLSDSITLPTVSTGYITSITATTATGSGNVSSDGGATVTDRGIQWSTSQYFTTIAGSASGGIGTGSFTAPMTGLTPGTTYYVRAYATNSVGTATSYTMSFTTISGCVAPTVSLATISGITSTTANTALTIVNNGGCTVLVSTIQWSVNSDFSFAVSSGPNTTGSYTITGLSPNTTYYVRGYAANSAGDSYTATQSFTTLPSSCTPPTVTTTTITAITSSGANSGGNVTADGGCSVTVRGIEWSYYSDFSSILGSTSNGTGTGFYTSTMSGLSDNTTFYVRAYATNSSGTGYGSTLSFTTLSSCTLPTVTTASITAILATSATGGGNVTATGGCAVTARGVCWSTSTNPTISNSHTTDGTGTGSFTSSITSLAANTTYYVRAYATNYAGTAYGSQVSFTTLPTSTFKYDVDTYYCGTCSFADNRLIDSHDGLSVGWYYYLPDIGAVIYVKAYLGAGGTSGYNIPLYTKASTCAGVSCTP